MENWVINHAAMVGLWECQIIEFEGEGHTVDPDTALVCRPETVTTKAMSGMILEVIESDVREKGWTLRPVKGL